MKKTFFLLAAASLALLSVPCAQAQLITSFDVSGQAPTGNIVLGQGAGAADGNANDGAWQGFNTTNSGSGISTSNFVYQNYFNAPGGVAVEAGDGNLQDDFLYSTQGAANTAITFSLNGLTIGQPYTLVIYASLGNSQNTGSLITLSGGAVASAETLGASSRIGDNGSVGLGNAFQEFSITPAASTINFRLTPDSQSTAGYAVLQGLQITEAIPEPSTYAMLAGGVGGLLLFQRARRKA